MRAVTTIARVLWISLTLLSIFVPPIHCDAAASSVDLQAESVSSGSRLFWENPLDWVSHKASDTYLKVEDIASKSLKPAWENIGSFGGGLLSEADTSLNDAIKAWRIDVQVTALRETVHGLLQEANAIKADFSLLTSQGLTLEDISNEIAAALPAVLEELQEAFPPPEHAPNHEDRQIAATAAFEKAETVLIEIVRKHGMPEDKVSGLRAALRRLKLFIVKLVVMLGDLAEQHPVLLEMLLGFVISLLFPQSWLLRPLLTLFGFGYAGPVKGTAAAWAQRMFFGGIIPKGSWFSALQRAAMKG